MKRRNRHHHQASHRLFTTVAIVVAALVLCCAYAGHVPPDKFLPAPFLTLAFVPVVLVAIVTLLIALVWRRWLALCAVCVAIVMALPIIKMHVPRISPVKATTPNSKDSTLTVMTYNVLGFNCMEPDLAHVPSASMRLILDSDADVVVLQEAYSHGCDVEQFESVQPYRQELARCYPYRYCDHDGLAMLSKYPFTTVALGPVMTGRSPVDYNTPDAHVARAYDLTLSNGTPMRIIATRMQSYNLSFGKGYTRVSPHIKPAPLERMRRSFGIRAEHAKALHEAATDNHYSNVIVCGDFNDVTASNTYWTARGKELRDAWLDAGAGFTYTYNRHHLLFRIDHILYRGTLQAVQATCLQGGSSDHYPLLATFRITPQNE